MKYKAEWFNPYGQEYYFDAKSDEEAKMTAFQAMCRASGDTIDDLHVYREIELVECNGEYNPNPTSATCKMATRDFFTGEELR